MKVLDKKVLDLNVDCCEFVSEVPHCLSVGCYQLNTEINKRIGCVYIYDISNEQLQLLSKTETDGILDMKWRGQLLAIATSEGRLELYSRGEDHSINLIKYGKMSSMALSVSWNDFDYVSVSYVDGCLAVYDVNRVEEINNMILPIYVVEKAHQSEVWISKFDANNNNIFYSGSDGGELMGWDIRAEPKKPILTNDQYNCGVTTIESNQSWNNQIIVGSYDETVKIWDKRHFNQPISQIKFNDGVWRLRSIEDQPNQLFVASMRDGFYILNKDEDQLSIEYHYLEHKSLAYGLHCKYQQEKFLIASASFYDNLLSLWSYNK